MHKFIFFAFLPLLASCASLDNNPPKYIQEAWTRSNVTLPEVKDDMKSCGYKDTVLANDLNEQEIVLAEKCMKSRGYELDLSSYQPNNCYGRNSPYLCNRLWGGKKPELVPVRQKYK